MNVDLKDLCQPVRNLAIICIQKEKIIIFYSPCSPIINSVSSVVNFTGIISYLLRFKEFIHYLQGTIFTAHGAGISRLRFALFPIPLRSFRMKS